MDRRSFLLGAAAALLAPAPPAARGLSKVADFGFHDFGPRGVLVQCDFAALESHVLAWMGAASVGPSFLGSPSNLDGRYDSLCLRSTSGSSRPA